MLTGLHAEIERLHNHLRGNDTLEDLKYYKYNLKH